MESLSRDGSVHVTDEKFNTYSHLIGLILALMGTVHLVVQSAISGTPWHIVAFSIYGVTLMMLFLASVLHHGVNGSPKVDLALKTFDYAAIYLLIAGTVTPVTLVLIQGAYGWTVFGVSWAVAVGGVGFKIAHPKHTKGISNTLYLAGGWLTVLTAIPVYRAGGWLAIVLMAGGGVLYSLGAIIFAVERPNPVPGKFGFHEIWHLFVMSAALLHYLLMQIVILPFAV